MVEGNSSLLSEGDTDIDGMINEEIVEYKVYKVKPYLNSDRQPFGLTINSKSKDYIQAQKSFSEIVKIRGKQFRACRSKVKIVDVTHKPSVVTAVAEVMEDVGIKGNVQIKVYSPGKKGAAIELRKLSDTDYKLVDKLKDVITVILDGLIAGNNIEQVLIDAKKELGQKSLSKVTSKYKRFTCAVCNFETKFSSSLKGHMTRIHPQKERSCHRCSLKFQSETDLNLHITTVHKENHDCQTCELKFEAKVDLDLYIIKKHGIKRMKETVTCKTCDSTFRSQERLKEHCENQHAVTSKFPIEGSPCPSPPRKKQELVVDVVEDNEIEMIDITMDSQGPIL